jgi:potassium/hydrogen antiporter
MHHDAVPILIAGVLLGTGVAAALAAARLRRPALVVFLGLGMAIGTDGLGWIDVSDYGFARSSGGTVLATAFEPYTSAEKALIGWAGLRGAVPVILATIPVINGVPRRLEFFNIAFFAVLVSTVIQGRTVEMPAVRLGLTTPDAEAGVAALV